MTERGVPPKLDGFTFVDMIGQGGFADVFRYEQTMPTRQVAIKVLLASAVDGPSQSQFHAEANVMAQLSGHPSIVPIYQAGVSTDGRPYLAMEYCPPPSLAGRFRAERFAVPEALETMIKISSAVETAHRAGILHRDIKPHNILTSSYGAPMLTDFGIAGTTAETADAGYGLSVPWSPPEALGEDMPSDPRSDVYSLAATLYSLLAGRSPFEVVGAANDNATLMSRIERQPVPRINRADLPDSVQDVLVRAMSKTVGDRHPTAMAFARALQDEQTKLHLAQTRIDVLDASSTEAPAPDTENRTQVRPVQVIVPDQAEGTRIRPVVIQPVSDAPPLAVDDRTARRSSPAQRAEPVPDTMARGGSAVADKTDGSHFLEPAPTPVDTPSAPEPTRSRSPIALLAGGVLAAVIIAIVAVSVLAGSGTDDAPLAQPTVSGDAPSGDDVIGASVAPPIDLEHAPGKSAVTFSWSPGDPENVGEYLVRTGPSLDELGPATSPTKKATARVAAPAGEIACIEIVTLRDGSVSSPLRGCEVNNA